MNVALFCIVVQSKPYLWHWKMYFTLILTLFRVDFFGAANGWATKRGQKCPPPSQKLSHTFYNDETWHSYSLPKEGSKTI